MKWPKKKAQEKQLQILFEEGDVRDVQMGTFDAALTIFNAVGHLSKDDFELAIVNIGKNLRTGGWYIFDNFNLDYMLHGENITKLTIDWIKPDDNGGTARIVQYSTIDIEGVLASHTKRINLNKEGNLQVSDGFQTLQIYRVTELEKMLTRCGFTIVEILSPDGIPFEKLQSERFLLVARKLGD